MERKRWPWRKKSSQRGSDVDVTAVPAEEEEQLHEEELRVRQWEEKVQQLNEKLVAAMADAVAKENAISQHAKVAEEAVSGWEKAEAEAAAAKRELEEVVAEKVGIEERRHRLENSLRECTRQLQVVKEEDAKELDAMRQELAVQRASFLESKRISEVEIRVLQMKLDGVDRENSRLKYELHLLNKELEIRAEEREYAQKAAEISHRQHLDNVQRIAKLEAECQRLRGLLVRKKPPAGHMNAGTARSRRSRASSFDQETQMLSDRLSSTEEETKMLKETLARRNEELQSARVICARTATKLSNAQGLLDSFKSQNSPTPSPSATPTSSAMESHLRTSDSFNDHYYCDTNDDEVSCAESWASALIAELAHFKKDKDKDNETPRAAEPIAGAEHVVRIVQLVLALVHPVACSSDLQPDIDRLTEAKDRLLQGADCALVSEFLEALSSLLDRAANAGAAFKDGPPPDDGMRLKEAEDVISRLRQDLQTCEQKLSEITACNALLESRLKDSQQEIRELENQLQSQWKQHPDLAAEREQLQTEAKMTDLRDKACIETTAAQEEKLKKEREIQVEVEMEVAEASEKLAECQRTIQILGKQLKALASPANSSNKLNFSGVSSFGPCSPNAHEKTTEPKEGRSTKPSLTDADYQIPNTIDDNKTRCPWEEQEVVAMDPSYPANSEHIPCDPIKSVNKAARAPHQRPKSHNKFFTRLFSCTK